LEFAGRVYSGLFIIENCSVPHDQRVWKEALSVKNKLGFKVYIISPKGSSIDNYSYEMIEGIEIYRYTPIGGGRGPLSYFLEYANAFIKIYFIFFKLILKEHFKFVHIGNPPDLFFPLALVCKLLDINFFFDVHDLGPEYLVSKYKNRRNKLLYRFFKCLLKKFEYWTSNLADIVIVTNNFYRKIMIGRNNIPESKIFVVRNAPKLEDYSKFGIDISLKNGRCFLLCYFGVMGETDGVDILLEAVNYIVNIKKFRDFKLILIGPTDPKRSNAIKRLNEMVLRCKLENFVEFTGYLPWKKVRQYLNTCDICLSPDPFSELSNVSTMIKIMEYMAHGKPILSFNLLENKFSAGNAAVYVNRSDPKEYGDAMVELLFNEKLRTEIGKAGLKRFQDEFNWEKSERNLIKAYKFVYKKFLN